VGEDIRKIALLRSLALNWGHDETIAVSFVYSLHCRFHVE